ncbi:hypothetical protein VTO42DRAFT_8079 [Malbranchea cinnamomea]
MDLVATVRKEGSRGGRGSFKWSDVQTSQYRENYLGHSLMAPVGRWQQGRDLSWYTKGKQEDASFADAAREEEIRRIKDAEQEAMARALGLPVAPKPTNANLTPLGGKEVERTIKETTGNADDDETEDEGVRGIGFGGFGAIANPGDQSEKMEGVGLTRNPNRGDRTSRRHWDWDDGRRSRGRSRDRERSLERKSRRRDYDSFLNEKRHRSRSRDRREDRARSRERRRRRSTSTSRSVDRERRHRRHRHYSRSRSPDSRRDSRQQRGRPDVWR